MTQLIEETFWQAVLDRDFSFDGKLFYGVHSTKIYCRPTCPSRRPNRSQVSFYRSLQSAEADNFRPCKRCHPQTAIAPNPTRDKVIATCRYIEIQPEHMPTLAELSDRVEMSPSHLQRVFKQTIGVTPFEYANAHRIQHLKQHLHQGKSVTDALYEVGYGSSSRLYETSLENFGMTPASYKQHGKGEDIRYAIVKSPLDFLLIAATDRGLCSVQLGDSIAELEAQLRTEFRHASVRQTDELQDWMQAIVNYLSGSVPLPDLPCDVRATAFQIQVWEALKRIPIGTTVHYSDIACKIGQPTSVRAVARACATNPIALLVPCHRVTPKSGGLGGYRWGVDRKRALLELEKPSQKSAVEE